MKSLSMRILQPLTVATALSLALLPISSAAARLPIVQQEQADAPDPQALEARALQEAQAGKTDEAIRDYAQLLAGRPDWKEGWWNLGSLQYSANRFADAKSTFSRVVQFAPRLGTAWALLGLSEFETGDFDAAQHDLETALSLGITDDDETRRVATYHLALLLIQAGSFERASTLLLATANGGPPSPQAQFALGLGSLRVPLLPRDVDASKEAIVASAGHLVSAGDEAAVAGFPAFLSAHPDLPYAHFAYALRLEGAGRDDDALAELRAETLVSPASPLPWREIGTIEQHLGRLEDGRAAARKAAALTTSGSPAPEQRIVALYASASGSVRPDANPGGWSRAMSEYAAGQYASAIADLKPLLQAQPGNGTGWAMLGLSEYALKDFDAGRIHLERGQTLGLNASPAALRDARYTLGLLLLRAGDFERATDLLASTLKLNPQDRPVRDALGLALLHRSALPDSPAAADSELLGTAGEIAGLLEESRYDQAFALFKTLLAKFPSTPFLHYAYGTALLSLSEFEQAAAQMRSEIALSPSSPLPYLRLASVSLRQHAPAAAIEPAQRALALEPEAADPHYLLGRALLETGEDLAALHELETASKLSPGSPEIHFNLAKAYTRANMPDAAARERATFAHLHELAELGKSHSGNAIYAGPHDPGTVTTQSAPAPKSD